MLCVEDHLDGLRWAKEIGLEGLFERSRNNLRIVEEWVEKTDWVDFLAESAAIRSSTSVCLKVVHPRFLSMSGEEKSKLVKEITGKLSKEGTAHDVGSYKDAPPGFRIWCGPTIEPDDVKNALEGLDRAFRNRMTQQA
jgi:phosphoserine aminotransferase